MKRCLYVISILALTSCAVTRKNTTIPTCAIDTDTDVFAVKFRPLFQTNSCNNCHNVNQGTAPKFGHADLDIARNDTMDLVKYPAFVKFEDPSGSRLVDYLKQNHPGGNGRCSAESCSTLAEKFKAAIQEWGKEIVDSAADCLADGGNGGDDDDAVVPVVDLTNVADGFKELLTPQVTLALGAASGAQQTLSFNVGELSPGLGQAAFEIKAVRDLAGGAGVGTYILREAKLGSTTKKLRVQDIRIFVNGVEKTQNYNFSSTDHIINAQAFTMGQPLPFAILGLPTMPTFALFEYMMIETAADKLSFEFKAVGPTDLLPIPPPPGTPPANLTEPEFFAALVGPILAARCLACHRTQAYALRGSDVAFDRTSSLGRITKANPRGSELIQKGAGLVQHAGGTSVVDGSPQYQTLIDWINRTP